MRSSIVFGLSSFRESSAGVSTARFRRFQVCWRPMNLRRTHLSGQRLQTREPQQVVRRTDEVGVQLHAAKTAYQSTAQPTIGFHPAEDLFDALAFALAHRVTGVTRG